MHLQVEQEEQTCLFMFALFNNEYSSLVGARHNTFGLDTCNSLAILGK